MLKEKIKSKVSLVGVLGTIILIFIFVIIYKNGIVNRIEKNIRVDLNRSISKVEFGLTDIMDEENYTKLEIAINDMATLGRYYDIVKNVPSGNRGLGYLFGDIENMMEYDKEQAYVFFENEENIEKLNLIFNDLENMEVINNLISNIKVLKDSDK